MVAHCSVTNKVVEGARTDYRSPRNIRVLLHIDAPRSTTQHNRQQATLQHIAVMEGVLMHALSSRTVNLSDLDWTGQSTVVYSTILFSLILPLYFSGTNLLHDREASSPMSMSVAARTGRSRPACVPVCNKPYEGRLGSGLKRCDGW